MRVLRVFRVLYGKKSTPIEDREYKIKGLSPVGNRQEFLEYAKRSGYDKIEFVDVDGVVELEVKFGKRVK